ncbi:MAG: ABC transporter permease [Deltaproteobacteria bacterium]|nr:ABC transporter permease [Deltaproteobacteria bacterium]
MGSFLSALRTVVFIAGRQLWERKLLNAIALGGVTLGVTTLVVMHAILGGFEQKFTQSILEISPHVTLYAVELRPRSSFFGGEGQPPAAVRVAHLTPSDRQARIKRPEELSSAIAELPGAAAVATSTSGTLLVEYGGKTRSLELRGVSLRNQERVTSLRPNVVAGDLQQLETSPDGLAIGTGLARDLGLEVGSIVHAAAPGAPPTDFRVVAIFEVGIPPIDKGRGYTQLRAAQTALGRPDVVDRVEVRLRSPEDARSFAALCERAFGYDAESWQEANASSLALLTMQSVIASFVLSAILVVGGFGILAVQIMIVLQKQRDIAILRSVGFRRADILRSFLLQGVVLSLLGGLLGDGIAKLIVTQLATLRVHTEGLVQSDHFLIYDDMPFYVTALGFALVIGVLASILPAWRASRVEPVDVLRGLVG